jgi:hypothetical protein
MQEIPESVREAVNSIQAELHSGDGDRHEKFKHLTNDKSNLAPRIPELDLNALAATDRFSTHLRIGKGSEMPVIPPSGSNHIREH